MLPLLPLELLLEVVDQPVIPLGVLLDVLLLLGELGMEQPSFTWNPSVAMDQEITYRNNSTVCLDTPSRTKWVSHLKHAWSGLCSIGLPLQPLLVEAGVITAAMDRVMLRFGDVVKKTFVDFAPVNLGDRGEIIVPKVS